MFLFGLLKRLVELVVLGAFAYFVVSGVQVVTASRAPGAVGAARVEPVLAVVAAGKPARPLSSDFESRLDHAASLYQAGRAPRLVVLAASTLEAARARAFLAARGVPARAVSLAVAPAIPAQMSLLVREDPPRRALVVADSWQTLWLTHLAGAKGLSVAVSPIVPPDGGAAHELESVAVQSAAVCWGRLAGFSQTGFIAG